MNSFIRFKIALFLFLFFGLTSFSDLSANESTLANIFKAAQSVVKVYALTKKAVSSPNQNLRLAQMERYGAGVLISPHGILITNAHTVQGAQRIAVTTHDQQTFAAEVIGFISTEDLVFLKIESQTELPFSQLADARSLRQNAVVYSVGNSVFLNNTVSEGKITGLGQRNTAAGNKKSTAFFRVSFKVYPGDSGTPIFTPDGDLLGITLGNAGQETIAISSESIRSAYSRLKLPAESLS